MVVMAAQLGKEYICLSALELCSLNAQVERIVHYISTKLFFFLKKHRMILQKRGSDGNATSTCNFVEPPENVCKSILKKVDSFF